MKRVLECSSKGDRRFSAFYAKVNMFGKYDSIENHYQLSKRFGVVAPTSWREAKGKDVTHINVNGLNFTKEMLSEWYSVLWTRYLSSNPELVEHASKYDEFNDIFRGKSINCQADEVRDFVQKGEQHMLSKSFNLIKNITKYKGIRGIYAGIGSRETPKEVLDYFSDVGAMLGHYDFLLRSGGAEGADQAFERGRIMSLGRKEIYLPWKGFCGSHSDLIVHDKRAYEIAEQFHPYWHNIKGGARNLQARNTHQIMGEDFVSLSNFVLCWTKDGKRGGGTGQALRLAEHYHIPIFDAGCYSSLEEVKKELKTFFVDNSIFTKEEVRL